MLFLALGDAKVPDARYFAFWWNIGFRVLRRYDGPTMKEIKSNNRSFDRSLLFQCAKNWNALPAPERNIQSAKEFKKKQKCKLKELLPYNP